jgi:hypothetical protein
MNEVVPFMSNIGSLFIVPKKEKIVGRNFSVLHFSHNLLYKSYFLRVMLLLV